MRPARSFTTNSSSRRKSGSSLAGWRSLTLDTGLIRRATALLLERERWYDEHVGGERDRHTGHSRESGNPVATDVHNYERPEVTGCPRARA